MSDTLHYKTGDIVVLLTDMYANIEYSTIGIVTSVPDGFALVNCAFGDVRGAFPCHQVMHVDAFLWHNREEATCE